MTESNKPAEVQTRKKLIRNALQCNGCGGVIESKHRHDFQTCHCGSVSVDGGLEYQRIVCRDESTSYKNLVEYKVFEIIADPIQVVKNWVKKRKQRDGK